MRSPACKQAEERNFFTSFSRNLGFVDLPIPVDYRFSSCVPFMGKWVQTKFNGQTNEELACFCARPAGGEQEGKESGPRESAGGEEARSPRPPRPPPHFTSLNLVADSSRGNNGRERDDAQRSTNANNLSSFPPEGVPPLSLARSLALLLAALTFTRSNRRSLSRSSAAAPPPSLHQADCPWGAIVDAQDDV